MKKVTLKDIANELNVTISTVSHALNGMDDISEKTKNKVFDTAKRMGYISNSSAVALRSGKTNTVAVIVPDISNPHIAYQIKLIEDKMKELNYSIIILNTNEDEDVEYDAITTACSKQVDGILICPCQRSTKNIEFLEKLKIPYSLIGRYFADIDTNYVCADDVKGGYLAGRFLIEKNCKRPIYIGAYNYIQSSKNRFSGLKKAYEEENIEIQEEQVIQISPKLNRMNSILDEIVKDGRQFDSIVAFSDIIAFEIISHLKKYSDKKVPVVGFDAINSHLFMPFYNISVGMIDNGWAEKATEIIVNQIKGETKKVHKLIDVKLYEFNT